MVVFVVGGVGVVSVAFNAYVAVGVVVDVAFVVGDGVVVLLFY